MDTTMNQGVFLSIPKSDIKFFKELAKKMGWDIDIREDFLKAVSYTHLTLPTILLV